MEIVKLAIISHVRSYLFPFLKAIRFLLCFTTPRIYAYPNGRRVSVRKPKNKPLQIFIKDIVAVN
jgi:hypothetical protein